VFPNPQDALPLPARVDVEQYRKLAKDLVKACASRDAGAIESWARRWLESLARSHADAIVDDLEQSLSRKVHDVTRFARSKMTEGARQCVLADAQFVLARSHGFESWPKLAAHLDALAHTSNATAEFEAAADAIVAGDEARLQQLLRANPELIRARSTREHRATLLHYVSANGVEGYRQRTPKNAVRIAEILLDAGAHVDAESDVYGGKCTALGLVATSVHPYAAGVQKPLMQLLLDRGADVNHPDLMGNRHSAVFGCLANGQPEAAVFLAEHGARLGLVEAAGIGRIDVVRTFFDERGRLRADVASEELHTALEYACAHGDEQVVTFLLGHGADLRASDGARQTALHHAAMGGNLAIVALLIARGAPLEATNVYGGTVLGQTLWSAAHGGDPDVYVAIIETLIAAGAKVPRAHPPVNDKVDAVLARHGSTADSKRYWYGEGPIEPNESKQST
jgi:ankyrin repeat protein